MPAKQINLFDLPPLSKRAASFRRLRYPIWTENKAKLIQRYLYYFVLITKHGSYIDGFAGPQEPNKAETWAAKLAIENEPRWLRHFYLFEQDLNQYEYLRTLKESQPSEPHREIQIYHGDFNDLVHSFLGNRPIKEREATFCLLDQRTFECHWSTVSALARYKTAAMKIELFYFLPSSWLGRAMAAQKNTEVLRAWWGRNDWGEFRKLKPWDRAVLLCRRFKQEFKYESVNPWPIYEKKSGGRIMYYMIHSTDHLQAPNLMHRAYHMAVIEREPQQQLQFEFQQWKSRH
jgi:three-Cys-motif partner protein